MQDKESSTISLTGPAIGLRGIAYYVGDSVPIEELSCMANDAALLERFKAAYFCNFSRSNISLPEQAVLSAQATLRKCGMQAGDIDAVVIGFSELREWTAYPEQLTSVILEGLGMNNIPVVGVTLAGCANVTSALRIARNMVIVDGYRNVLVVETNLLRNDSRRLSGAAPGQTPDNVFGDGAVSFVVTSDIDTADFDLLAMDQIVSFPEGDNITMQQEIATSTAASLRVIKRAIAHAGLAWEQINCVLLNNLNVVMMAGLLRLYGFTKTDFYIDNILRYGHVWSADGFINLHDYCEKKAPAAGTHFLLIGHGSTYYSATICRKRDRVHGAEQPGVKAINE
ncbi:3-oxoacyl-[acyl-carrier-protein] synthase III C-terminal domain-containing protein [Noviherbaspirillum sp. CPCC 100848]|uniref:3-oxoacyl-[acyl-carrier-protein] synthase III C-terminal domain-containing protein n=1 Tax=Noviherbaspirillum album TaxID=3080276 RepID=A0ABU6J4F2_9BURK|nr:3-oxoacyl-[acyl-carrier-protein] synthase III C-terminal domain-containing protein [Noviherbaspirillum sp. CPCC 100848]MEC4718511.1 3-oxoacyl-[acyl-carrier-protein] synthase III C-terminal domain-containing protein [Noviherbaspirillum sp. CPCC 100848]